MNTDLYTDTPTPAVCWRWIWRGSEGDQKGRD